jgi:hypothetical protein
MKTPHVFLLTDDVKREGSRWIISGHDQNGPGPPSIFRNVTKESMVMEPAVGSFFCYFKRSA